MDYKTIVVSVSDSGVATVKFNQPEKGTPYPLN